MLAHAHEHARGDVGHISRINTDVKETLSDRLRFALDRSGMSQAELAERIGVTKGSVSNWILGRVSSIKSGTINKLADVLDVDARWLVTGAGSHDQPAEPEELAEVIDFKKALQRASEQQREMLGAIASAAYKSVMGDHDEPKQEAEPPGAGLLSRVFHMLKDGEFSDRFDRLPSRAQGILVATLCSKLNAVDEGGELDPQETKALINHMVELSQHFPD